MCTHYSQYTYIFAGAGKTTTFSILTGDISPTSGTAFIAGHDIRTDLGKVNMYMSILLVSDDVRMQTLAQVQQQIGYCPQFDALIERMTGRELLTMFARLRGIPEHNIKNVVTTIIKRLDLIKNANKLCGNYRYGLKQLVNVPIIFVYTLAVVATRGNFVLLLH